MPPRNRKSGQPQPSPFDRAVGAHNQLVKTTPVEKAAMQRSLEVAYQAGDLLVRSQELGTVRFANQAAPLYAGALALNESGLVQPPLTDEEAGALSTRLEMLNLFTEGNGETGQSGPTDPNTIPTDDVKKSR